MPDKPQLVIGRVVSMEHGRPTISVPVGPGRRHPTEDRLLAAARAYRDDPNSATATALKDAAMALKEV